MSDGGEVGVDRPDLDAIEARCQARTLLPSVPAKTVLPLIAYARDLENARAWLAAEVAQLESVLHQGQQQSEGAIRRWRAANATTRVPDLGTLLQWLMDRVDALEALPGLDVECSRCGRMTDGPHPGQREGDAPLCPTCWWLR